MEDKRILKTKLKLKRALVDLLEEKPFEKINVTELCNRASVSRITFYTYYSNKHELVDEYLKDMQKEVIAGVQQKDKINNKNDDPIIDFDNVLDTLMDLYVDNKRFFRHVDWEDSPYLFSAHYRYVLDSVEEFARKSKNIECNYSLDTVISFICNGLWGILRNYRKRGVIPDKVREETKMMLKDILESNFFK